MGSKKNSTVLNYSNSVLACEQSIIIQCDYLGSHNDLVLASFFIYLKLTNNVNINRLKQNFLAKNQLDRPFYRKFLLFNEIMCILKIYSSIVGRLNVIIHKIVRPKNTLIDFYSIEVFPVIFRLIFKLSCPYDV